MIHVSFHSSKAHKNREDLYSLKLVLDDTSFLAICLATVEKQSIAICSIHVTRCNLGLQFAIVSKIGAIIVKCKTGSALCNSCKPKKVARQVAESTYYTLQPTYNLSRNAIVTQVAKKIVSCNTSFTILTKNKTT